MNTLPWQPSEVPLMLAPMQGLTNEALRQCFIERYGPDVLFTEFVRVNSQSRVNVSPRPIWLKSRRIGRPRRWLSS